MIKQKLSIVVADKDIKYIRRLAIAEDTGRIIIGNNPAEMYMRLNELCQKGYVLRLPHGQGYWLTKIGKLLLDKKNLTLAV